MSLLQVPAAPPHPFPTTLAANDILRPVDASAIRVIRRNGAVSPFDASKIAVAMTKAFLAVEGRQAPVSTRVNDVVRALSDEVVVALVRRSGGDRLLHIEDIQDQVELALMRSEHPKVARAYVLYREEHARARAAQAAASETTAVPTLTVRQADGSLTPLDEARLARIVAEASDGLDGVSPDAILAETRRNLYEGLTLAELAEAPVMAARTLIETEPNYAFASARLLLDKLRGEALSFVSGTPVAPTHADMAALYGESFPAYLDRGIAAGLIDPELARFDVARIADALIPERDRLFQFLGLQTLYDRYFLQTEGV
ncbi:ATP cone domain-containing protein, partial [uncultured Aureimonas sp.]|uniref:ATP cone domain-containing protein n=1 Tax=uncultured Aureimonas sp. TaxID=1604662 RepID=UPI0025EC3342